MPDDIMPVIDNKRFFRFRLDELFDVNSQVVRDFVSNKTDEDIKNWIIREVAYPFFLGMPDDTHWYIAYWGKVWISRPLDYWQKASETISLRIGDCEDSSVAFVTAMRAYGYSPYAVYEIIGLVKDKAGNVLGGHGWSVFFDIDSGMFRLYESTLDEPPGEYPVVEDITKPVVVGDIVYDPYWIFNDQVFIKIKDFGSTSQYVDGLHSVQKYRMIHKAYGLMTKFEREYDRLRSKVERYSIGLIHRGISCLFRGGKSV